MMKHGPMRRSGLEDMVEQLLMKSKVQFEYETTILRYTQPAVVRKYTPDFRLVLPDLKSQELFLEVKGYLKLADRKKLSLVIKQNPEIVLCLIFGRASNRLSKKSKTTYGEWATKAGIPWIDMASLKKSGLKKLIINVTRKQAHKN